MKFVGDFHIHSRFARATSKDMNLENLDKWAQIKGIKVMGTGDFTHPLWFQELKEQLEPAEQGLYQLKPASAGKETPTRFLLTSEISCIYSKGGKVRKVHLILFAPSFEAVEKINTKLSWVGNLKADGRPIIGIDAKEVVKIALDASPDCMVIPAHCLPPESIVHTQGNLKPIKDIKQGDYVYTHKNRWQKVTEVFTRPYKGKLYHIKPYYFREGLSTTSEHPFYALKTQKHCRWQHGFCHPNCLGSSHCCNKHKATKENFTPTWVLAENLEKGDVLLYPRFMQTKDIGHIVLQNFLTLPYLQKEVLSINDILGNGQGAGLSLSQSSGALSGTVVTMKGTRSKSFSSMIPVSSSFCRLIGYYLAEGSEGKDLISFTFAQHEETYLSDVRNLMRSVFSLTPSKERSKDGGIELIYYSKIIKDFFSSFCYEQNSREHRAFTKALPQWILELPQEKQIEILLGWWRGDAGYTSSRILMNQMKILFLRLGIIPSVYIDTAKRRQELGNSFIEGRKINAQHDLFAVNRLAFFEDTYGLLNMPEFQKYNYKTKIRHGWIDKNYVYLPIRDIEIENYEGNVYNLEVEEDNSYVTEFATVHNCWTPWFSVFGSKSGFNALEECFDEYTKYIYAIETGLSSDPAMNWRLSALDNIALISNSDSHSLEKIGREANVFDTEVSYSALMQAIKTKDPSKFLYTVEFFPEEGKYHYDGHRVCNISMSPVESKKHNNICPKCKKPLVIGVLNRVEELADRPSFAKASEGKPAGAIPFKSLIPLQEIIADALHQGVGTKQGKEEYEKLVSHFGNEFAVLLDATQQDLQGATIPEIAEGIKRVREGKVNIEPGYDGEYGKIKIFGEHEERSPLPQKTLF
ncbi:MAG: Mja hyp1 intein [Parcubacteria group bacterium Greene0714_21]|nr:MAG: Mja hyp1 intein [Parcubacteria group bacterium Greene0416_39]TSC97322.1 MAG: Mja hyp1 intein [Parcubacteria group bacterium Greene1014_47]TSD03950.1 MAG: Mja hyp1 intein [Parcubacteria group bacterium Greene0714_21]